MQMNFINNEGVLLHCNIIGNKVQKIIKIKNRLVINPSLDEFKALGWQECKIPANTLYKRTYEDLVIEHIRKKYSIDDELAILRQRDSKPSEFAEYNTYCEECKLKAKAEGTQPEPTEEEEIVNE